MIAPAVFLKEKRLGKATFFLFLFTLPLSVRKVFFVFSPDGTSGFNEYTDISLYLSDMLLLGVLIVFILENRNTILSILWWKQLFHVEQFKVLFFAPLPFLLWSGLSIFWSKSHLLSAYSFSRLLAGYLLYIFLLLYFVPRGTISLKHQDCSTWNIRHITFVSLIIGGFFQSVLAILQFISQSSLGLSFLKESILSSGGTGVAKIILAEESLIRAYGLFPHPNILGGFLGITILFTVAYPLIFGRKMFHVEHLLILRSTDQDSSQNVPRGTIQNILSWIQEKCSTWNNVWKNHQLFHVEQSVLLYRLVLGIQVTGFLLTFSKGAFLGLLLAIGYFVYKMFHVEQFKTSLVGSEKNVPRGTIQDLFSWFRKKCSTWNIPKIFLITITVGLFLGMVNWQYFFTQPFKERVFLEKGFFFILKEYPFQGEGIGQSVFAMQDFFSEKLFPWQFQPVHNLFLLIFSETGLIGAVLFLIFLILIIVPRGTIRGFLNWIKKKCSTWNNRESIKSDQEKMFHVEHLKNNETDLVKNVPRGTIGDLRMKALLEAVILFLGVVSLFDHYLWDIQQGQLLFWLMLGLFSSSRLLSDNIDKYTVIYYNINLS